MRKKLLIRKLFLFIFSSFLHQDIASYDYSCMLILVLFSYLWWQCTQVVKGRGCNPPIVSANLTTVSNQLYPFVAQTVEHGAENAGVDCASQSEGAICRINIMSLFPTCNGGMGVRFSHPAPLSIPIFEFYNCLFYTKNNERN